MKKSTIGIPGYDDGGLTTTLEKFADVPPQEAIGTHQDNHVGSQQRFSSRIPPPTIRRAKELARGISPNNFIGLGFNIDFKVDSDDTDIWDQRTLIVRERLFRQRIDIVFTYNFHQTSSFLLKFLFRAAPP